MGFFDALKPKKKFYYYGRGEGGRTKGLESEKQFSKGSIIGVEGHPMRITRVLKNKPINW